MVELGEQIAAVRGFVESGGNVLYAIFITTLVLWFLIGERYWYFIFVEKSAVNKMIAEWHILNTRNRHVLQAIRQCWISRFRQAAKRHLTLIKALTNISVLLGLLGTITGMIALFEGQVLTQGGNVRVLADGVSRTIIPAMAGLVVAISGFYFSSRLEHRASAEVNKLSDQLDLTKQ